MEYRDLGFVDERSRRHNHARVSGVGRHGVLRNYRRIAKTRLDNLRVIGVDGKALVFGFIRNPARR